MKNLLIAALACVAFNATAQSYPSKPIRIIVPFSPGGGTDIIARQVAEKMSPSMGQPVVVENRDGAGGRIGSEVVARSPGDGHTIVLGTTGTHTIPVFLSKSLPYDPVKDFTPITNAAEAVNAVAVNPSLPVKTMPELIEHAKRNPGKLNYGTQGAGTYYHFTAELVNASEGMDIQHVPYKGVAPAVAALVAGDVQVMYGPYSLLGSNAKAGRIRLIAMVKRAEGPFPDLPQLPDLLKSFEPLSGWIGFLAPAGLQPAVLERLNTELVKALRTPDVNARLNSLGLIVVANTQQQFAAELKTALAQYSRVIKAAGLQAQ
jgi:tripartite-type tricarboxylate transporter receptor subunit TctC